MKTCIICGKEIKNATGRSKYCEFCKYDVYKSKKDGNRMMRNQNSHLSEIAMLAKERGMSYGRYKEKMYFETGKF